LRARVKLKGVNGHDFPSAHDLTWRARLDLVRRRQIASDPLFCQKLFFENLFFCFERRSTQFFSAATFDLLVEMCHRQKCSGEPWATWPPECVTCECGTCEWLRLNRCQRLTWCLGRIPHENEATRKTRDATSDSSRTTPNPTRTTPNPTRTTLNPTRTTPKSVLNTSKPSLITPNPSLTTGIHSSISHKSRRLKNVKPHSYFKTINKRLHHFSFIVLFVILFANFGRIKTQPIEGRCDDQADAKWIVIRGR
jgi:hypothetical protein